MNSYFLPVGLLLAFTLAWMSPEPGEMMQKMGLISWMIVIIFLINGFQTSMKNLPGGRSILIAPFIAILISLIISPFIGLAVISVLPIPAGAAIGLVVMATVPPTLSSAIVMTGIAGGNVVQALFLTILLNLIGVFTIPFMLQFTLESVSTLSISPLPLLKQLILLVLIPFLAGMILKSVMKIPKRHWLLKYLPSSCVIATVWMSVSASIDIIKELNLQLLLLIMVGAIAVHGFLLLLCWLSRFVFRPSQGDWLALLFTASQKTLPVAIAVLASLNQPIGLAIVACIIFHFLQLFIDSIIASKIRNAAHSEQSISVS